MLRNMEDLSARELEILGLVSEGASDKEIAKEFYLSVNTVKWHNRQIYAKLNVENRTQAVSFAQKHGLLEPQSVLEETSSSFLKSNLPEPISAFIGRNGEIVEVIELLQTNRLVTLTGPGGIGKTRLSLQIARELLENSNYTDGIFLIELASVAKWDQIETKILETLGISELSKKTIQEVLIDYLDGKKILLVLDNFEHLVDGSDTIRVLLESISGLSVLVTSRESLNLAGEQIYPVIPLPVPSLSDLESEKGLDQYEAIQLFVSRARSLLPRFEPSKQDIRKIGEICLRLDGLPLAIELAVARIKVLSLNDLIKQLDDRFSLLTDAPKDAPERHQTLEKAIEWSYQMLSDEEQILFSRLAVFQGSCTIDAVEKICCTDLSLNPLDGLTSLFSKNLIQKEEGLDGEIRFYFLETIHEYARICLQDFGEEDNIHESYAEYYINLAEEAKIHRSGGGPKARYWGRRLSEEKNNLRAIMSWAINTENVKAGLRMIGAVSNFSNHFSRTEWKKWIAWSLERIDQAAPKIQSAINCAAGFLAYNERFFDSSKEYFSRALKNQMQMESLPGMAWIHSFIMMALSQLPDTRSEVTRHYKKALELFDDEDEIRGRAFTYNIYGNFESESGNYSQAESAYRKVLDLARETDDRTLEAASLLNLSCNYYYLDRYKEAYDYALHGIRVVHMKDSAFNPSFKVSCLDTLAGPLAALGQARKAVVLLGAVFALCQEIGIPMGPEEEIDFWKYHDDAKQLLEIDDYQEAWAEGQAMSFEELVALALEDPISE